MQQILIKGGKVLKGTVKISGAKNAVLPIMAATILSSGKTTIKNVPFLRDIKTFCALLETLGGKVVLLRGKKCIEVDTAKINRYEAPYELVRTMRASCLVMGPLLARLGKAKISLPGGCAIGERPLDLHLKGLKKLGARIRLEKGYIILTASKLKGNNIYLDIATVTGTENLMMAAVLAKGVTTIGNAAKEPEIVNLAEVLNKMGGSVAGAGTDTIIIKGVSKLHRVECSVIPDRIETGTFMIAAVITNGAVHIKNCVPEHMESLMAKLIEAGAQIDTGRNWIKIKGVKKIKPVDIKTAPYPGFPTDMQAQIMALMTLAKGASVISENIFENRFMHVAELKRMGARIEIEGHTAYLKGVERLTGAPVMATDLRASASLILAGLAAKGETIVSRIYHIDRGYEEIEKKLSALGADIRRNNENNTA